MNGRVYEDGKNIPAADVLFGIFGMRRVDMDHKPRVFGQDNPCPFEDCRHHRWCAGAWQFRHGDEPYVPDNLEIEHLEGMSGASFTGESGRGAMYICKSWLPIEPLQPVGGSVA